ncbi:ribokinase [Bacillus sp. FJAT-29790]|uniref:ribokinase n=1 Tax=Bacillus sp. FJAT-29790 TaxID=1895002 RepID=UPI001C220AE1|nr:ribokinase [Bacillus sp. FJAT-29790]MBU8880432.1 ribokinase [Bacillus sp. FJAT-29790]
MIPKIAIIGSLNMDFVVQTTRHPVEGETLLGEKISYFPGGKGANQAVGASRLGADVKMIGSVGNDLYGNELISSLKSDGVDVSSIKEVDSTSTGTAIILLAKGENSIIVIQGANAECSPKDIDHNIEIIKESDIVLIQMEIPLETVCYAVQVAKRLNKTIILNPAPAQHLPSEILNCIDYITPNETELAILTKDKAESDDLESKIDTLLLAGVKHVITTLGSNGVAYKGNGQSLQKIQGYNVPVVDTTGAGDAFNAGFAYSIGQGKSIIDSIVFANKTAALAIGKSGAQSGMPLLKEVLEF